jgi:hypothetical protein
MTRTGAPSADRRPVLRWKTDLSHRVEADYASPFAAMLPALHTATLLTAMDVKLGLQLGQRMAGQIDVIHGTVTGTKQLTDKELAGSCSSAARGGLPSVTDDACPTVERVQSFDPQLSGVNEFVTEKLKHKCDGRDGFFKAADDFVSDAKAIERVLLVIGEPGVGKSTALAHAIKAAQQQRSGASDSGQSARSVALSLAK